MKKLAIGIDIGGINTAFGLVDENGDLYADSVVSTKKFPLFTDYPAYVAELTESLHALADSLSFEYELVGIGIGAPNANYHTGVIEHPANLWKFPVGETNPDESRRMFPLVDDIKKAFPGVECRMTNDANAATIGEMIYGNAKGMKDFIMITLGTGLGSGFVANGEMIYGHDGFAGEFGHVIAVRGGRQCGCGRRGCLETYVSATGIKRTVFELMATMTEPSELREHPLRQFRRGDGLDGRIARRPHRARSVPYHGRVAGICARRRSDDHLAGGDLPLRRPGQVRKIHLRADAMVHGGEHDERLQEQGKAPAQRHPEPERRHPRRFGADLARGETARSLIRPQHPYRSYPHVGRLLFFMPRSRAVPPETAGTRDDFRHISAKP